MRRRPLTSPRGFSGTLCDANLILSSGGQRCIGAILSSIIFVVIVTRVDSGEGASCNQWHRIEHSNVIVRDDTVHSACAT